MSEPAGAPEDGASLQAQVSKGLRWSVINQVVGRMGNMASGIVVARILVPDDFGLFAAALAIVNVLFGLNDLGMLLALVRSKEEDLRVVAGNAFTMAAGFSTLLYGAVFAGAPWFARLMGSPDSAPLLRALALTIVIDGVTTASHGLIVRAFRQDHFAFAEFASMPIGIATSIGLAAAGAGPWALVVGQLVGNLASGVGILVLAPFLPRPRFDPAVVRTMLRFGAPLAATSMVEYVLFNADYLVIGRVMGPVALGFYLLAYNVSGWPVSILTDAVRRVSIAGFARLADDDDSLVASFHRTFAILLTVSIPVVVMLSVLAPALVEFIYGDKWSTSGQILRWLAFLGGARIVVGFTFDLLLGAGRSRTTLILHGVWLVALVPALWIGAETGEIPKVALAHVVVAFGLAVPLFLAASRRLGVDIGAIGRALRRPLLGGTVALVVGLLLIDLATGNLARLAVAGPAMLVVYAVIVLPANPVVGTLLGARRRLARTSSAS